jgi:hypothetical protein
VANCKSKKAVGVSQMMTSLTAQASNNQQYQAGFSLSA